MTENIKKILQSEAGRELREYLEAKTLELKNIDSVGETVVDLKAQRKAYQKLRDILLEIGVFTEEVKMKDPKDDYSV